MHSLKTHDSRVKAHDLLFEPFLNEGEVKERVRAMGQQITADYEGKKPIFLSVLNGAFIFAADLVRHCEIACETCFVKLSSYDGLESTGQVQTVIGLDMELTGRDVIIVEDIIDSGKTLHHFLEDIQKHQPASIKLATLLLKPEALQFPLKADYLGFEIPNKFVIGYGLDYNGEGRNLPAIYQLCEE